MSLGNFWVERENSGKLRIGGEDYDVQWFGGGDHEMVYTFSPASAAELERVLGETQTGSLEQMIEAEFGRSLEKKRFSAWLEERGIEYDHFTWTSYD